MADAFPGADSALFGYTGFVGTTLRRTLAFTHCFNSKNVGDARGRAFDTVVFAAMPAVKWMANKEPAADLAVLNALQDILGSMTVRRFILISTIDIYQPADSRANEDGAAAALSNPTLHAYGKHRAMLEAFVRERFADHAIVRLPGLFGLHLRKNYIYDMLRGNNVAAINRNSAFQWYDVSRLAGDLQRVLALGAREVNLFPEPVPTQTLIDIVAAAGALAPGLAASDVGHDGAYAAYDITTKYGPQLGGPAGGAYCAGVADVCEHLKRFLAEWAMMQRTTVSCIAWDEASNAGALELLRLQGVRFVELAPTRFWEWEEIEAAHAAGRLTELVAPLAADLRAAGMLVSSMQAILFKKPDLLLFGPPESCAKLQAHVRLVVDLLAAVRDAGVARPGGPLPIVFGAPKNRQRPEGMGDEEADAKFLEAFAPLAQYAADNGCTLCVEPNAPAYSCNYITTSADAKRLIERAAHPGLRVHLDTGCMTMAGEDVAAGFQSCAGITGHVHVSEPFLANYLEPKVDHAAAARALRGTGYAHLVSLELLTKSLDQLAGSLAFYQSTYWPMFARP